MCFFHTVKLYTAKIKYTRSFDDSTNKIEIFNRMIKESVIVTLLIIFAVLTYFQLSLWYVLKHLSTLIEHIQKLEILYEFRCTFSHQSAGSPIYHVLLSVQKHRIGGRSKNIHRQQTIHWIFTQTKLSSFYRHKPILTCWVWKETASVAYNLGET